MAEIGKLDSAMPIVLKQIDTLVSALKTEESKESKELQAGLTDENSYVADVADGVDDGEIGFWKKLGIGFKAKFSQKNKIGNFFKGLGSIFKSIGKAFKGIGNTTKSTNKATESTNEETEAKKAWDAIGGSNASNSGSVFRRTKEENP